MQPLIRNLERLRRRTRVLLVVMRGSMWLAGVLAVVMFAALSDFALRFPGAMRAGLLAVGIGAAVYYFVRLLGRAVRVNPALPSLALRLERLYPAASGRLASAVAFATAAQTEESPVTTQLTRRTTDEAQGILGGDQINKLIDPMPAARAVLGLIIMLGLLTGVAVGAPDSFRIAVQRWTDPFGDARWPNRYQVQSLTDRQVTADNAPIPFAAQVLKGDREGLRTWVVYRFTREGARGSDGPWQRTLMTRQNEQGIYERPVEPQARADGVEFYFEAGDDSTLRQSMRLIAPPALTAMIAQVAPPPYASAILTADRHDLLQPPRPAVTVEALEGSRVQLRMAVEGSFTPLGSEADAQQLRDWLDATFSGLLADVDAEGYREMRPSYSVVESLPGRTTFEVAFALPRPVRFRLNFTDAFGSRYEDQRLFVFEVRPDRSPRAAVTLPRGDESVLATAALPVAAEGHDDVAIERLELQARLKSAPGPMDLGSNEAGEARARVEANFDLAPLKLKPGDEVALVAVARDNFKLGERVHEPVESPPRMLRIIGEQDLSRQIHAELADLRQRALKAHSVQQQLLEAPATTAAVQQQQDLTQRTSTMDQVVKQMQERIALNRLEDEGLNQTLDESHELLKSAGKSSERAAGELSSAAAAADPQKAKQTEQARSSQQQAAAKLAELAQLLDEGRDAYELKQKLMKLTKDQEALIDEVRKTVPKTLGRELDQLDEQTKRQLAESAEQQEKLSEDAKELIERMRSTAAAISRQSSDADQQAMAEAMRQAAETATEQALDQKMEQASKQVRQNQLAEGQQTQGQAQQTLKQMLEQMNRAEQLKQQILRRKLAELVEAIRKLRDQQQAQIDRLMAAQRYEGLDAPMLTLRRNTLSVSETARGTDPEAAPIADQLDKAAGHQAQAVRELRAGQVDPAAAEGAERASLAALQEALKLAEQLSQKAQQQLTEDERRKLIEQYTQALEQQKVVHGETQQLAQAAENDRNRRWRAESLKTGKRQEEVGAMLDALSEKVGQTVVYSSVHDQIDRWIQSAAGDLSGAQPGAATTWRQQQVIDSVQSLIDSLNEDPPQDDEFAENESGGGGGGGAQGPQPLIPPVAELKLLKARQVTVQTTTRALDDVPDAATAATILKETAAQQEALAEIGGRLVEQLQQSQRPTLPQVPGPGPEPEPEPDAQPQED